ncbi:MAG: sirohydrochlorin cobaltochelatase [Proteobacteria bacterium]|nr:sirohydrochlorin cobaltochelatase [Pseudomonadota bacterium]MBU1582695.1 sirohydrochlorin cobaltochelatase [Pseudomonadota bacterium]MBU2452730.1 sirohydrochlorin cobaltochelatase [Pseudomonadota bacterium]MBU2630714.1 sirohydrochlorin cobaltochelatase [Pseudomonadota bacterium]
MKNFICITLVLLLGLILTSPLQAKTAIIIANFGTSVPEAIESIENITSRVKTAFPGTDVRVVFTSNIIRSIWEKRSKSPKEWTDKGISNEILFTKNLLSTFGELKTLGFKDIIVQPTHLFHMEQYHDLLQYVNAINSIKTVRDKWKPFNKIALGRPALGTVGDQYPYHDDLKQAVKTLANDIALAGQKNAALVYMGHGNELWSTGIYVELQNLMRETYPEVKTFIGCVEGYPGLEDVKKSLGHHTPKIKNILLKPLMIVAGDHATNDMAGDEEDSWKTGLNKAGFNVDIILQGLGSNNQFADLFVSHIRDAAKASGIDL